MGLWEGFKGSGDGKAWERVLPTLTERRSYPKVGGGGDNGGGGGGDSLLGSSNSCSSGTGAGTSE